MDQTEYRFLDSGNGRILERFGDIVLDRMCSTALWAPLKEKAIWTQADAIYNSKSGWSFTHKPFSHWTIKAAGAKVWLRLEKNGQIGLFPEHILYIPKIVSFISRIRQNGEVPTLLNLFGYTGICSVAGALAGASVLHLDLSRRALTWANKNFEINQVNERVKIIRDDALKFLQRKARHGASYDLIVADPPLFSRTPKGSWKVNQVIHDLLKLCIKLLNPHGGLFILTTHSPELDGETLRNITADFVSTEAIIEAGPLRLKESDSERLLHRGYFVSLDTTPIT
ncbi:MAG: hypothetical protein D6808_04810 [Candidatus Dadabacteria bacterium]|nr:MAG: hypothetical protein D6808_04810 [Candidatus Dadabacteria bacterium]